MSVQEYTYAFAAGAATWRAIANKPDRKFARSFGMAYRKTRYRLIDSKRFRSSWPHRSFLRVEDMIGIGRRPSGRGAPGRLMETRALGNLSVQNCNGIGFMTAFHCSSGHEALGAAPVFRADAYNVPAFGRESPWLGQR